MAYHEGSGERRSLRLTGRRSHVRRDSSCATGTGEGGERPRCLRRAGRAIQAYGFLGGPSLPRGQASANFFRVARRGSSLPLVLGTGRSHVGEPSETTFSGDEPDRFIRVQGSPPL